MMDKTFYQPLCEGIDCVYLCLTRIVILRPLPSGDLIRVWKIPVRKCAKMFGEGPGRSPARLDHFLAFFVFLEALALRTFDFTAAAISSACDFPSEIWSKLYLRTVHPSAARTSSMSSFSPVSVT